MWHAPWIPWLDWDHFRVAFNPMIVSNSTLVSSLLNEDREWDFQQTATWMVPSVASSLNLIPMIPNNNDDKLIWKDATSGEFSPRVAYKSIIKGRRAEKDPIWVRNQAYHDHVQPSFFITFNQIKSLVAELNSALTTPQDTSLGQSTLNVMQGLLQEDFVVFVDAACKDLRSAAGIIVTKSDSEFVEAFSVQLQATLPLEAEAWALLHTVHWCLIQGWHNVTFAVDCQPLVQGIKSRKTLDWRVAGVFARILDSLDRIPSATVSWIPRSGNEKAHKLAKRSFNSYRFGFFNAEELAPLVAI
uniref:RNase H type-1 domain-containing protein n=1 Tax=Cannabis sativa TaxID=3483 RepID=A0A803NXP6_CANSA